jgi:hypothetical protein
MMGGSAIDGRPHRLCSMIDVAAGGWVGLQHRPSLLFIRVDSLSLASHSSQLSSDISPIPVHVLLEGIMSVNEDENVLCAWMRV